MIALLGASRAALACDAIGRPVAGRPVQAGGRIEPFGGSEMSGATAADSRATRGRHRRRAGPFLLALGLLVVTGCASRLESTNADGRARLVHPTLGYAIDPPAVLAAPGWKRIRIAETDLALRHRDGSISALASSCRPTRATPAQLAFHVRHAIGGERIGEGTDFEHRGLAGHAQTLERVEDEDWIRIRTVTLRGAECSYDWFLLAPDPARFDALRPAFDAWWQSFEPAAREHTPVEAMRENGELAP